MLESIPGKHMRDSFSSHERYGIASAAINENEINGMGGAHAPTLMLPVRMDFHIHPEDPRVGFRFLTLNGRLGVAHQPFAVALPADINIQLRSDYKLLGDQLHYLNFALDQARIAYLERIRNGGDLKLTIDLRLTVEKVYALHEPPIPHDAAWGLVNRLDVHLQKEITIPRSAWISRVLPQIGYGTIHLIELPAIPLAAVECYKEAFQALQRAQEHHKQGNFDEAAAACRVALERFFDYPEVTGPDKLTRKVPTLKKSWETKLGQATYEWLNGSLRAVKQATNPPHHAPGPHYDQFEAQMLIMITVAIVAYAAKHDLPANP